MNEPVHIRVPVNETPLSPDERLVAIREGFHPVPNRIVTDVMRRANREFAGRYVWVRADSLTTVTKDHP